MVAGCTEDDELEGCRAAMNGTTAHRSAPLLYWTLNACDYGVH
jgi:hypothetical protein